MDEGDAPVTIDADENGVVGAVTAQMSERTSFIVLDQITSATAMLFPAQRIAAEAHRRGIRILVDGAHAPAQLADPVGGLQSDWWVGNFHKFPCAPRGTALLVVPPEGGQDGQDLWPLIDSWGFADPFPERFDEQGTQDLCGPIAAPESLREIERLWGWDVVRRYMSDLADYAERRVSEAASEVGGEDCVASAHSLPRHAPGEAAPRKPHAAGTGRLCPVFRDRILNELHAEVAVTQFDGELYLRLTAHAYVTADAIDRFAEQSIPTIVGWLRG